VPRPKDRLAGCSAWFMRHQSAIGAIIQQVRDSGVVKIKPSRIQGNEREVLAQLTSAISGNLGVDADGYLWLCGVKLGRVSKDESGEMSLS